MRVGIIEKDMYVIFRDDGGHKYISQIEKVEEVYPGIIRCDVRMLTKGDGAKYNIEYVECINGIWPRDVELIEDKNLALEVLKVDESYWKERR